MTIETKFKPGDEVWYMRDNKCVKTEVKHFEIHCNIDSKIPAIKYHVGQYKESESKALYPVSEIDLFATKKELLDSL